MGPTLGFWALTDNEPGRRLIEPFPRSVSLTHMETPSRWIAASLALLACAAPRAADFELSAAELARVQQGETVIRASLDGHQRRGTVRAALIIQAPPAAVFQAMTRCDDALDYVPHLRACRVQSRSADGSRTLVEHEVDFGWFAPRLRYVFRADLVADRRIEFSQVHGDFRTNEGVWEFEPAGEGTLVRYRVQIDPPGYVPTWLAKSTFKRDLPRMLSGLRRHCEAGQVPPTLANSPAYRPSL
jgi:ribosome-associated toxin RatA of RatAB toxin-antitoxin module